MLLAELEDLLDDKEIGDPALVELLDREFEDFREDLLDAEPETMAYLVATASLFREQVKAFDLMRRVLPMVEERPGGISQFYEDQERVWRGRKDKRYHDVEYLRIVLGVKDHMLKKAPKKADGDDLGIGDEGMDALLQGLLGGIKDD